MQTIIAGSRVTVSIPLIDGYGNEVRATTGQLTVYDENDTLMLGSFSVDLTDLSAYDFAVDDVLTTLPAGQMRGMRRVMILASTTDAGQVRINYELVVEAATLLVIPTNTWLTYSQAQLLSLDIPNLEGWHGASEKERTAALKDAWYQLARLKFTQNIDLDRDQTRIIYPWSDFDFLRITLAQWNNGDDRFKRALTRGQLVQADYLLSPDDVGAARRVGIMQKRTGESSEMFRTTKPYEGPICPRAMREVNRYLDRTIKIGR